MSKEKEKEKVVEVCQDCGDRVEVEKKCPTGFICDNCLEIARDDRSYDAAEDSNE